MYYEKLEPILEDLEKKEIDVAGGSVVGMVLGIVNSLVSYIANLTIGKKRYADVEDKNKELLLKAESLKAKALKVVDDDPMILAEILKAYKTRKSDEEYYQEVCINATEFCMNVVYLAKETAELVDEISKVGNKMLSSDFKICKLYAVASIKCAMENVKINLRAIKDEQYRNKIETECDKIISSIWEENTL